jgi:hypothetical protein
MVVLEVPFFVVRFEHVFVASIVLCDYRLLINAEDLSDDILEVFIIRNGCTEIAEILKEFVSGDILIAEPAVDIM